MPKAKAKTIRKDAEEAPEKPRKRKISRKTTKGKKKTSGNLTSLTFENRATLKLIIILELAFSSSFSQCTVVDSFNDP